MNGKLSVKIAALGLLSVEFKRSGLKLPEELDADIDDLVDRGEDFAKSLTDEESDAAVIEALTEMAADIKRELEALK